MAKKRKTNYNFLLPQGAAETIFDYCQDNSLFKKPEVDYFKYLLIVHIPLLLILTPIIFHTLPPGAGTMKTTQDAL